MDRDAAKVELALQPCVWSDAVAAHLGAAIDEADEGDPVSVDWLQSEHEGGRLALVAAMQDGVHIATAAYRVEQTGPDLEMVIVGCGAGIRGLSVIQHFLPPLETMARFSGCASIRFHTRRAGLVKVTRRQGYRYAETVMRKAVIDGQQVQQ